MRNSVKYIVTATPVVVVYIVNLMIKLKKTPKESEDMEENKENVCKNLVSKIPIPLPPLPQLSANLMNDHESMQRLPLKTLNYEGAGPSRMRKFKKEPIIPQVDMKYVTVRPKRDTTEPKNSRKVFHHLDNNNNGDFESLEPFRQVIDDTPRDEVHNLRIKNIKKTLKRPHSRELQGLPAESQSKRSRSQYDVSIKDRILSPDYLSRIYSDTILQDYNTDIFQHLLHSERKLPGVPKIPSITRACLVNWLLKLNGPDGNLNTLQAACFFFDTILATETVTSEMIQLVAVGCYWIAQKMHGPAMLAKRLIASTANAFTTAQLLSVERTLLKKLNFPSQPVTVDPYINFFAWCCDSDHPGEIEVAASFIAMAGLIASRQMSCEYPSVIAAAAVRNALILLKRNNKISRLLMNTVYRTAESKATNFSKICIVQRMAIRTISSHTYSYKTLFNYYDVPPYHIARKVAEYADSLAVSDARLQT